MSSLGKRGISGVVLSQVIAIFCGFQAFAQSAEIIPLDNDSSYKKPIETHASSEEQKTPSKTKRKKKYESITIYKKPDSKYERIVVTPSPYSKPPPSANKPHATKPANKWEEKYKDYELTTQDIEHMEYMNSLPSTE